MVGVVGAAVSGVAETAGQMADAAFSRLGGRLLDGNRERHSQWRASSYFYGYVIWVLCVFEQTNSLI